MQGQPHIKLSCVLTQLKHSPYCISKHNGDDTSKDNNPLLRTALYQKQRLLYNVSEVRDAGPDLSLATVTKSSLILGGFTKQRKTFV